MNTAKHSNGLSSPPLRKKRFQFWIKSYLPAMLLATIIGTVLDSYFIEKQFYRFPIRFLPNVFSINIIFTVVILPVFVLFYLYIMNQLTSWGKTGLILLISLLMPILEKLLEVWGMFEHSADWKHIYSFFGYFVFFIIIFVFHRLVNRNR